jgi:hypothetical protein
MTLRDAMVIGGTLLGEPKSLAAFWHLAKCLPRALRARRTIMGRRKIDDAALTAWFHFEPVAQPVGAAEVAPAGWPERVPPYVAGRNVAERTA